jgi:hypothetical protein
MKRVSWFLCSCFAVSCVLASSAMGFGGPPPAQNKPGAAEKAGFFLIDDFESGSLQAPRKWWTFDIKDAGVVPNANLKGGETAVAEKTGKYSLKFSGEASNWYVGGCGVYIAKEGQDLSKYSALQMDIYGNGEGSGTLKIELFDDDNGNWQVEQDPAKSYAPVYDDKLVCTVKVDWEGWRRVDLALDDFVDDNPGVGDDIWNPQQANGSGGLLQLQFIALAGAQKGVVNFNLDNILLTGAD